MATVYLVVENDWESNTVLAASLDAAKAKRIRDEEEAKRLAKRPRGTYSVWSIDVEEQKLS